MFFPRVTLNKVLLFGSKKIYFLMLMRNATAKCSQARVQFYFHSWFEVMTGSDCGQKNKEEEILLLNKNLNILFGVVLDWTIYWRF